MGNYSSSDITANIEVNLNNIDRSTQDAATMAAQLQDWGTSIGAAVQQLQDYNTLQGEVLQTSTDLAEMNERIVEAARQLKQITAESSVNFRDLAQNAREIQNAFSGLGGMGGAPYVPGVPGVSPASVVAGADYPGGGMPGAPAPDDYGIPDGAGNIIDDIIDSASLNAGNGWKGKRGSGNRKSAPASTTTGGDDSVADTASYGEKTARSLLGINYWMPGGKIAALGRYVDRLSKGGVTSYLGGVVDRNPRLFGSDGSSYNQAYSQSLGESILAENTRQADIAASGGEALYGPAFGEAELAPMLESAGETASLAGAAATPGILGALGTLLPIAAGLGAAGYIGMQGYNAYSTYQQQGQLLGSLTGQTGAPGKMVGMEATDFINTLFNPLLSYGTAKEIQMTGLAAGFQGNPNGVFANGDFSIGGSTQGLLGQYTSFASGAYQNYGISPQESLQMFNAAIIAAGGTVQQLTASLSNLAQVSATTNTSFKQLQMNFTNQLSTLGGLGMQGQTALSAAQSLSLANAGNSTADVYLQKQDIGGTGGLLQTMPGLALTAAAAGMSFTQAFAQMGTSAGANRLLGATNTAVLNILKNNLGLYPNMPNLAQAVNNNLYQAYVILATLLPDGPDGQGAQWTPQAAHDWLMKELGGTGGGESPSAGGVSSVTGLMNSLTGGATGTAGVNNAMNTIASKLGGKLATGIGGGTTGQVQVGGQWENLDSISFLSSNQQQQILSNMLQGKDEVRSLTTGLGGEQTFGTAQTLAQLMGNNTLQGINNGSITQGSVTVELGPKAAALFTLINNPQKLTNQQVNYLSSMGLSTNTHQTSGYVAP